MEEGGCFSGSESRKPLSPPGCQLISQSTAAAWGTQAGTLERHSLSPPWRQPPLSRRGPQYISTPPGDPNLSLGVLKDTFGVFSSLLVSQAQGILKTEDTCAGLMTGRVGITAIVSINYFPKAATSTFL